MNLSQPFSPAIVAAAVALALAACGSGSGSGSNNDNVIAALPAPENIDAADEADGSTLAQAAGAFASIDAEVQSLGLPTLQADQTATQRAQATASAGGLQGRFPGLVDTRLVANNASYGAQIVEPEMQNAWGIAIRPAGFGGHFWVGAAGTGKSIQYVGDVGGTPLFQDELKIVETLGPVSGVAFNPGGNFVITQQHPNGAITAPTKFFFANLSGTISAWTERARPGGGFDHPADSVITIDGTAKGSVFSGTTVAPKADRLYVADFSPQADVRVYDGKFAELAPLANPFRAASGEKLGGFEAFNVQTLGDRTFAMYAPLVPPQPNQPLPPKGRLAEFDADGKLVARWFGRGYLNNPWGVALAPKDFGLYGGCLLVGNFGDGTIVAFHPRLRVALDYVRDENGRRVVIDGLWGLQFGNGASLGEANHMYYAAGPNREKDGLFGKLQANSATLPLLKGVSLCR
jgi:uncharacterized protein (TIGR03118 family)